jgi:hypothetical protein
LPVRPVGRMRPCSGARQAIWCRRPSCLGCA